MTTVPPDLTEDRLLGDRVVFFQPKDGYRVSMDTVILAAAVPAHAGQRVFEAGLGTGGAALCLAARVPALSITGVEVDPTLAALARHNIAANAMAGAIEVVDGDLHTVATGLGTFDHAMVNPPYLETGHGDGPPSTLKRTAHLNGALPLADWIGLTARRVRPGGSFTIIHRADRVDDIVAALHGVVGDLVVCPLWPRPGRPAKRVVVQGRKAIRGRARLHPGLVLHDDGKRYSDAALAITRDGAALDLGIRGQTNTTRSPRKQRA